MAFAFGRGDFPVKESSKHQARDLNHIMNISLTATGFPLPGIASLWPYGTEIPSLQEKSEASFAWKAQLQN